MKNDLDWMKELHKIITKKDIEAYSTRTKKDRSLKKDTMKVVTIVEQTPITTCSQLAKIALEKLLDHLWFLQEENIAFAFFDERISEHERDEMAANLKRVHNKFEVKNGKLIISFDQIENLKISDFVTKNTLYFFQCLHLDASFLDKKATDWSSEDSYQNAKVLVKQIHM